LAYFGTQFEIEVGPQFEALQAPPFTERQAASARSSVVPVFVATQFATGAQINGLRVFGPIWPGGMTASQSVSFATGFSDPPQLTASAKSTQVANSFMMPRMLVAGKFAVKDFALTGCIRDAACDLCLGDRQSTYHAKQKL